MTVALVIEQWLGAQTIDWFPRGPLRVDASSGHIVMGVLLAALLHGCLVWRFSARRRRPPENGRILGLAAKATHWGLYGLLLAMAIVGVTLTSARGDSLFNLYGISAFDPGNRALADQIRDIHAAIGWIIVGARGPSFRRGSGSPIRLA